MDWILRFTIAWLLLFVIQCSLFDVEDNLLPVALLKETPSGQLISEFSWVVPDAAHLLQFSRPPFGETVPGPAFYTGRPGYKLRIGLTAGRVRDGHAYLGAWFALVPGAYDHALDWPFPHALNLSLVGGDRSAHWSMSPSLCPQFLRPGGKGEGCGEAFLIPHERVLEEGSPFLVGGSVTLRVTVFLVDKAPPPVMARVFLKGHQLVSEYLWTIDELPSPGSQITSQPFLLSPDRRYQLQLFLQTSGEEIGLSAALLPGPDDDALSWPFPHPFELAAGGRRQWAVDPASGACPTAAFAKPRLRHGTPCGFRRRGKGLSPPFTVRFQAVLDSMPQYAAVALRDNVLVAEYVWKVPNIERKLQQAKLGRVSNLLSERFYSSPQGYLLQLQLKLQNGSVGMFLTLLEGQHDDLLRWPFDRPFQLRLLEQRRGADAVVAVLPDAAGAACVAAFWRPFGRNDACGAANAVSHEQLYERKFIRYGAILFKVVIELEEVRPPRFATPSLTPTHLTARFEWVVADFDRLAANENHAYFLDSDKFYLAQNSYRMMLRLYPHKSPGVAGLYAVLVKGEFDDQLLWPFPHSYRLEAGHLLSRTTHPGGCPEGAFLRPERDLAEWSCGEGSMVTHDTLFREGMVESSGGVRFAVTVLLQEVVAPPVAGVGLSEGVLVGRYSWVLKPARASLGLLLSGELGRLEGPLFYSQSQGYAMRLSLSLGTAPEALNLHWALAPGQHDDVLPWPFGSKVTVSFLKGGVPLLKKSLDDASAVCRQGAFERPTKGEEERGCVFEGMLGVGELLASYVQGDVLHVRTSVVLETI